MGAGPGDPELLTLRALKLMQRADIALYDNLISPAVLDAAAAGGRTDLRRQAPRATMRCGRKRSTRCSSTTRGPASGCCDLKGGDPFIFGRGGEEIDTLSANGIPLRSRARNHGGARRRRVRRHSAHASRLRAIVRVRHGTPQGRQHGPRLARARASAADDRRLHGAAGAAGALRASSSRTGCRRQRRRRSSSRERRPRSAS